MRYRRVRRCAGQPERMRRPLVCRPCCRRRAVFIIPTCCPDRWSANPLFPALVRPDSGAMRIQERCSTRSEATLAARLPPGQPDLSAPLSAPIIPSPSSIPRWPGSGLTQEPQSAKDTGKYTRTSTPAEWSRESWRPLIRARDGRGERACPRWSRKPSTPPTANWALRRRWTPSPFRPVPLRIGPAGKHTLDPIRPRPMPYFSPA